MKTWKLIVLICASIGWVHAGSPETSFSPGQVFYDPIDGGYRNVIIGISPSVPTYLYLVDHLKVSKLSFDNMVSQTQDDGLI